MLKYFYDTGACCGERDVNHLGRGDRRRERRRPGLPGGRPGAACEPYRWSGRGLNLSSLGARAAAGLLSLLAFFPAAALAAPGDLIRRIVSPEVQPGVNFGEVIASDGTDILVGEPDWWDGTTPFVGRAYLFDGATGEVKHTLRNPEPDNRDIFGQSVAIVGDRLIVGTPGDQVGTPIISETGTVYAFDRQTGELATTIPAPNRDTRGFGNAVAPFGGKVLVGAPSERIGEALSTGAVYLADPVTGNIVARIPNPEPDLNDLFSFRHAIADLGDGRIVVGTPINFLGPENHNRGSVYVLNPTDGEMLLRIDNPQLIPPGINLDDSFGFSVSAVGGNVVVGARSAASGGVYGSGAIYVFDGVTGELKFLVENPNPVRSANFGRSVAALGGNILVGAWGETVDGVDGAGAVYLYDGKTGGLLLHMTNPDPGPFDQFGWSVAAFGRDILVGARSDSPLDAEAAGSVYLFRGIPEPSTLVMSLMALGLVRK